MSPHIYIHFPYCLYKCHYCDFNSYAWERDQIPHQNYLEALFCELQTRKQLYEDTGNHFFANQTQIDSIFLGGGTPSLMRAKDVERLLERLQTYFILSSNCEITLESNPGTVDKVKFQEFKQSGINRISLGVQSFHEKNLKRFGRIHSGDQAVQAIQAALESGVERVSVDLIYGFPDQTLPEWQDDLSRLLNYPIKHISCYALTAEPDTIYTRALKNNEFQETQPDIFADMQELTYQMTEKAGIPAYEISNFASPGEESRHNLGYWNYQSYLGLGAGAWSNMTMRLGDHATGRPIIAKSQSRKVAKSITRSVNLKSPGQYMNSVQAGQFFQVEEIDLRTAQVEFMMLGLRLKEGISLDDFENRFGIPYDSIFQNSTEKALKMGWIERSNQRLKPTHKGFLMNNALVSLFLQ